VATQSLVVSLASVVTEMAVIEKVSSGSSKAFQGAVFVVVCMQAVFTVLACLFGHLWLKSVWRVRWRLQERQAAVSRIAAVVAGLAPRQRYKLVWCITKLQGGVRRLQAHRHLERRVVARAFEGTMRERRLLTSLVHGLVLLYLAMCMFIIATYGTCVVPGGALYCVLAVFVLWGVLTLGVPRRCQCLRCARTYLAGLKFSSELERTWLIASAIGFCMDVFVYNTFAQFVRAVLRFLLLISTGTDGSTLAHGISKGIDVSSCSLSSVYAP
jgi:hypothetical protein